MSAVWLSIAVLVVPVLLLLVRPLIASSGQRLIGVLLALVTALSAGVLYGRLGSPGLEDRGLKTRLEALREKDPETLRPAEIHFLLEQRVRAQPQDGEAWGYLGTMRFAAGDFGQAADAFAKALTLLGPNADLFVRLAEAATREAGGEVTARAKAAAQGALALEADNPGARFLLALGDEQDGRMDDALAVYAALVKEGRRPWSQVAESRLNALGAGAPADGAPAGPGPDAATVAAASDMTPAQRQAMIEGMVARLDARLREAPEDLEGWQRLIRSYRVLGRGGDADDARARAREVFKDDPDALRELDAPSQ